MNSFLFTYNDYNIWANKRLLELLDQNKNHIPEYSIKLTGHIFRAEDIWFTRISGFSTAGMEVFPLLSLAQCHSLFEKNRKNLQNLFIQSPDFPEKIINYQNSSGTPFSTPCSEILHHVFNHGTYHRGQIMSDLRRNGIEPVATDFILYSREQVNKK